MYTRTYRTDEETKIWSKQMDLWKDLEDGQIDLYLKIERDYPTYTPDLEIIAGLKLVPYKGK